MLPMPRFLGSCGQVIAQDPVRLRAIDPSRKRPAVSVTEKIGDDLGAQSLPRPVGRTRMAHLVRDEHRTRGPVGIPPPSVRLT
jgi:hypothetical protein